MPLRREEDFWRNTSILHFLSQNYIPLGWGSWNLQFLVSLPYGCCIPNLVKIGPVVLEKMLTHDERTKDDDGRQPRAIGHLSYSDDLKNTFIISMHYTRLFHYIQSLNEQKWWIIDNTSNQWHCGFLKLWPRKNLFPKQVPLKRNKYFIVGVFVSRKSL